MPRQKKDKVTRPSAGPESKPKSPIPSLLQNLFGKSTTDSAKRPSDAGMHLHRSASAGALSRNSGNLLPADQEEPIDRSPSTPPISGVSLTNQPLDAASTSSVEPLPTGQTARLHHSSPAPPAIGSSLATSHIASVHQSSSSVATLGPTLCGELPSSTDHLSIPPPYASSQQLSANISISSADDQDRLHSNRFPSQINPAATAPEHVDSKRNMFTKGCLASLRVLGTIVGVPTESMENELSVSENVGDHCSVLAKSVEDLMASNISPAMRGSLESLRSKLAQMATEANRDVEDARWKVTNYLQIFLLENIITGGISPDKFGNMEKQLSDIIDKATLRQSITILPCANAAFNDYTKTQKRVSCFKGTRQALLEEVIAWLADPNSNVYVLFGLAGIGKSTIAQTVAEKADKIHLLGASFFFSRDDKERQSAQILFTTIASQLCVYDTEFAKAIEAILSTETGKSAIRKCPLDQLETLILEPLRNLTPRKVLIVVDALDECDDEDAPEVIMGLKKLVQSLPSFKVVLTTRPQPNLQFLSDGKTSQKVFHLHDIKNKVVDGDIELYLKHNLAWEQVQLRLPTLTKPWAASDEDIQLLVRAAGRLFIIASTAVLFILDKTSTPKVRMAKLRIALDQDHTPFKTLNDFYTTILRIAVPEGCERDTVNFYQTVIGSIIVMQQPLSIHALATLADIDVDDITAVLGNLQPVIVLGSSDIPLVFHKSFPDYIQDPTRCEVEDLRIDPRFHHTQMAIRCLRLLNRRLKQNILELGYPARFMGNAAALKNQGLAEKHVYEQIPSELTYTCLHFSSHLESANVKDIALTEELEQFLNERLLNWLEALSWIGKLDSAHHALLTLQKQLRQGSSNLGQIVDDGGRFVAKFYDLIRQSALHTYHSALPFTPTETSLYKMYSKQMNFCRVLGGQKVWDGVITTQKHRYSNADTHIIFSQNSTLFACCTDRGQSDHGLVTIHDAVMGMPLGRIDGDILAITSDFSKAAAFNDGSIMLYNVKGVIPVATIKSSVTVVKLALSPDGTRLLAGLGNGTVSLWDTEKCEQIESIDGWKKATGITFSSNGNRAAFASRDGTVKLLDGREGKIVADLAFPAIKRPILKFSGDGSRLACLVDSILKVWYSRDGASIGTAEDAGYTMAISTDGSLLVTGKDQQLKFWSGNTLALLKTLDLEFGVDHWIDSLAIQNDLIGIASRWDHLVALYDINSHALVARLPFVLACALAFSPDCTRLAAGSFYGDVQLLDLRTIATSNIVSQEQSSKPTALAFSFDCSRLASGHEDGTIKLWETSNMTQLPDHKCHSTRVTALAFNVNGGEYASGSEDGVIQLWNGEGGEPGSVLACSGKLTAMALSSNMLAAATESSVTLFDLNSCSTIATLDQHDTRLLAFSYNLSLLAAAQKRVLTLWDTAENKISTKFSLASDSEAWSMRFLPDDSQLAIQLHNTHFYLFNTHDGEGFEVSENQAISRLGLCPSWHGIPVWTVGVGVVSRVPPVEEVVEVLSYPSDLRVEKVVEGSSMIALGCEDGQILLLKVI